jgi:hypothetical protein
MSKCKDKQEPVAYVTGFHSGHCVIKPIDPALVLPVGIALYTAPVTQEPVECMCGICKLGKREWVGLTYEEHDNIKDNYHNMTWTLEMFARAVEQALKEKNT